MKDIVPIHPNAEPLVTQDYQYFTPAEDFQASTSPLNIKRFFSFLRRWWWVPLLTLFIALGAATFLISTSPAIYVSRGRMWETARLNLPEGTLFLEDIQNFLGTQAELLKSARLQELALSALKATSTNALPTDKHGLRLATQIQIIPVPKSSVFDIILSSYDRAYTTAYLNALMNQYLEYKKDVRKEISGGTLASISSQVLQSESDLKADQAALNAFQRTNNLAILQQEGTVSGGYLASLKTKLSDFQLEDRLLAASAAGPEIGKSQTNRLAEYKHLCDFLETLNKRRKELLVQFAPENSWVVQIDEQIATNEKLKSQLEAENPSLPSIKVSSDNSQGWTQLIPPNSPADSAVASGRMSANRDLQDLKTQRGRLSKYLKPKHPKIVKLDKDIERAQQLLDLFRTQNEQQLAASRSALQLKIQNIQGSIDEWESKVVEANARIAEAEHLKQSVARSQSLYDRLEALVEHVDISRNIDQETLSILEPASPAVRSHKTETMTLGMAIFFGLAVGLGIVLLIQLLDDRVLSLSDICEKVNENVVGQLPAVRRPARKARLPLLEADDSRYIYAESFRNLRSAILFMPVSGPRRPKVILITSAQPNEGKSTVAANLARTFAYAGARVALVDCDLRKGVLHELLGLQRDPGLPDLLRVPGNLDRVLQVNSLANLAFIARGNQRSNTSEALLTRELDQVLALLRERFDYVLLDSSPLLAADDAANLAPKVDGTILVVRNSVARTTAVCESLDLLHQRQARILGIIFNGANTSSGGYRYYKYAEYYTDRSKADLVSS